MLAVKHFPGKGRGVVAAEPIAAGTVFERSPVIEIPREEIIHIRRTELHNYFFKWGDEREDAAIALGFGSLFNHSYEPNANFDNNLADKTIDFTALRPIAAGEEITINYNGDPGDRSRLWFPVLGGTPETGE